MARLIMHVLVTAVALFIAVVYVPGIDMPGIDGLQIPSLAGMVNLVLVAAILGLVNAIVRPILKALTCAVTFFTLGLFIFVINALMLLLTAAIAARLDLGLVVDGFVPALLGSIVVSVVSLPLSLLLRDDD